jgi:hypothetical protein
MSSVSWPFKPFLSSIDPDISMAVTSEFSSWFHNNDIPMMEWSQAHRWEHDKPSDTSLDKPETTKAIGNANLIEATPETTNGKWRFVTDFNAPNFPGGSEGTTVLLQTSEFVRRTGEEWELPLCSLAIDVER